jgi:hypothetical protein
MLTAVYRFPASIVFVVSVTEKASRNCSGRHKRQHRKDWAGGFVPPAVTDGRRARGIVSGRRESPNYPRYSPRGCNGGSLRRAPAFQSRKGIHVFRESGYNPPV